MQSLREKIKLNLDQNLKNRDEIATSTVRLILAAIKDHDIQNRTKKISSLRRNAVTQNYRHCSRSDSKATAF